MAAIGGLMETYYRARAPLRLGLAGGGTDIGSYANRYGGAVLNATVNMFAFASIMPRDDGKIHFYSEDFQTDLLLNAEPQLPINGELDLLKAVYNRMVQQFNNGEPLSFDLITDANVPVGSGLGTSSAITVAILGAFREWLNLPLDEYEIASLAFDIERKDLRLAGGKQDQYAAAFGGFNFMEFSDGDVLVNPLRIKPTALLELENNLVLFFTGQSRESASIIKKKVKAIDKQGETVAAMHRMKEMAYEMKRLMLRHKFDEMGRLMHQMWQDKKRTVSGVSNTELDAIYAAVLQAGALGGKVSGAGGGGFMFFYCPGNTRFKVLQTLRRFDGDIRRFQFNQGGLQTWTNSI
jgi:D-glycero-alpha-D-manno-heptose-7-phosphate kinase